MSKFIEKGVALSVMTTMVCMSLVVAVPAFATTIIDGDLVKGADNPAVYLISGSSKRVFPHASVYHSWGYPSDYSTVKTITNVELASYTDGTIVPFRDGSLFRGVTSSLHGKNASAVFVVSDNKLRPIKSAAIYQALYNDPKWTLVRWIPDNMLFRFSYPLGDMVKSSDTHPNGTIIKHAASPALYLIENGKKRAFTSWNAFTANRYRKANIVTVADTKIYADGANITGVESRLVTPGVTDPTLPGVIGIGLTVALAADTPASSTIIAGQATADLAHFIITNSDATVAKVTKVVLRRIGVSGDDVLENVYLYNGAVRLTDPASVSLGSITFANAAGLFTVPGNGSINIAVKSDIKIGTSGQTVGVQIAAATDFESNASVGGTYPISGNIMSIATADLARADFTGSTLPNAANIDPANDTLVWQRTLSVSQRKVGLTRFALREIGSINYNDLQNFRLFVDGAQVGNAVANLDANGYVTFAPATSYALATGSRVIRVLADVVGGSSRNFSFSLRRASDIGLVDSSFGVDIRPTVSGGTFATIIAGTQTINSGSVTVQKATNSPSGNIILGGSDVVLAKYTITAYGEAVKIETLRAGFTYTNPLGGNVGAILRNGRLLANGSQVGSTANLVAAGTSFTTNITVNPGSPVTLEVRADIFDNDGTGAIANTDTIVARLVTGSNNGQGLTSLTLINVPSADNAGNTLTVASGSMSLSRHTAYGNQTVVVPQTAYKLAAFNLIGNSTEDINVNTIQADFTAVTGTTFTSADLTNVYIKYGTTNTTVRANVNPTGNTWPISYTLAKNTIIPVEIYASLGSMVTTGNSIKSTVTISGTSASSGQSVNTGAVVGQTMIAGAGLISSAVDASSPVSKITVGNVTSDAAVFAFTTVNDSYKITEVVVKVGSADAASTIQNVILKDGATTLRTVPVSGTSATFSGLSVPIGANSTKKLTIALQLGRIGSGAGTSGANNQIILDSFKAINSQGVETTDNTDRAAHVMYIYKTIPTIKKVSLPPATTLSTGTITLARFSIAADAAGSLAWKKIIFTVNKTSAPVVSNAKVYDAATNARIAGTAIITTLGAGNTSGSIAFVATSEQQISGTKTYVLKADVAGSLIAGDNINTSIAQPSSYAIPAAYTTVAATPASFVWSDMWTNPHSETTLDWNNDYLVRNLPTDAQTLSRP